MRYLLNILVIFVGIFSLLGAYPAQAAISANTHSGNFVSASSQYLSIVDGATEDITGALTIAAWVKFTTVAPGVGTGEWIVDKWQNGSNPGAGYLFGFYNNGGTLSLYGSVFDGTNFCDTLKAWTPSTGIWYHVAFVFSGAGASGKVYVDGAQLSTTVSFACTTIQNNAIRLKVGAIDNSGGTAVEFMNGNIDDVRVWARALTDNEIAALRSQPCTFSNGSNLSLWYKLDNALTDSSGNAQTLTNNNVTTFVQQTAFSCSSLWEFNDF